MQILGGLTKALLILGVQAGVVIGLALAVRWWAGRKERLERQGDQAA
jgi:hypothetical protein